LTLSLSVICVALALLWGAGSVLLWKLVWKRATVVDVMRKWAATYERRGRPPETASGFAKQAARIANALTSGISEIVQSLVECTLRFAVVVPVFLLLCGVALYFGVRDGTFVVSSEVGVGPFQLAVVLAQQFIDYLSYGLLKFTGWWSSTAITPQNSLAAGLLLIMRTAATAIVLDLIWFLFTAAAAMGFAVLLPKTSLAIYSRPA
jgi:hypothetical protein